jgi:hypothetical protein
MLAALHTLTDPWADPVGRRALLEVALRGHRWRMGCWMATDLSYSAESLARDAAGARHRRAHGHPAAARRRAGLLVAASPSPPQAGHRPRHRVRWS